MHKDKAGGVGRVNQYGGCRGARRTYTPGCWEETKFTADCGMLQTVYNIVTVTNCQCNCKNESQNLVFHNRGTEAT